MQDIPPTPVCTIKMSIILPINLDFISYPSPTIPWYPEDTLVIPTQALDEEILEQTQNTFGHQPNRTWEDREQ